MTDMVPKYLRQLDEDSDGIFMSIVGKIETSLDYLINKIDLLTNLRDPFLVTSKFTNTVDVTITDSTLNDDGTISITCVVPDDIGQGWKSEYNDFEYVVIVPHKVEGALTVSGSQLPANGTMTFYEPEQLTSLYGDYGVVPDRYFTDSLLRGEVANAISWLNLKGFQNGYAYRGNVSGFTVNVLPVWKVSNGNENYLDNSELTEYPAGSGELYTTVEPKWVLFDDVAADVVPTSGLYREVDISLLTLSNEITAVDIDLPLGYDSVHTIHLLNALDEMGNPSNWKLTDINGAEFYFETRTNSTTLTVAGITAPAVGVCVIEYLGSVQENEHWAKTNYLIVEITPTAALDDIPGDSGDKTGRMIQKLYDVKPAHIEFMTIIESHSGTNINPFTVDGIFESDAIGWAGQKNFDVIPGDVTSADDMENVTDVIEIT